jgi:hypothetical protein
VRSFSFGAIQALILLFSQALTLQIFFYPLIILNILRYLPFFLTDKKIIIGLFLIIFAVISILARGASIDLMIILVRFYCGIIIVTAMFTLNKNLQITNLMFWVFILFVYYEYISLMFGFTPFTYANFVNIGIESEIEGRVSIGNNAIRTVGPSMNSSVSGSILAIMFFHVLIRNKNFIIFKPKKLLLLTGLFVAFVLCRSATAMVVFIFLLLFYVASDFRRPVGKSYLKLSLKFIIIFFILLTLTIISNYIFPSFLNNITDAKWNLDYFVESIDYKIFQISLINDFQTIFFGADLTTSEIESAGGDFIILSFIYQFGIIYVTAFIAYLFYICKAENRLFLFVALLSSMHYGTLFTLTGQVFFGALIVGSVCAKELLQGRDKLCDLKTIKPLRSSKVG